MKTRLLLMPLLLALVASLAACGGGSSAVPANAIALVGSVPITIVDFNAYFKQALAIAKHQSGVPPVGSPQYAAMRSQTVAYLVQVNELEQQAPKEHISVSQSEVTKYLTKLAKTSYGGSMAKLTAALTQQSLTMATARQEVYVNLLAQKIHTKVTKSAKATVAQEKAYYQLNISSYSVAASTTRSVEYILFKCVVAPATTCPAAKNRAEKKIADKVEQKLKNGANFEAMAKQYSDDPTTASLGGKFTLTKGAVVPAFQTAGFALKTGTITPQPVNATSAANQGFGWFIIKALGPIMNVKAHTTPFSQEQATIQRTLSQQQADKLWSQWLSDLKAQFDGKVIYQASYAPPTTSSLPTTT